jgi:hypothetical protein
MIFIREFLKKLKKNSICVKNRELRHGFIWAAFYHWSREGKTGSISAWW